jgi:hypothetical protein
MRPSTKFNFVRTSVCATMAIVASAVTLAVATLAADPLSRLGAANDLRQSSDRYDAAATNPPGLVYSAAAPFGLNLSLPVCNPPANIVASCEFRSGVAK